MKIKPIALAISTLFLPLINQSAIAGGFQLSDHSITSLGRSHAGYGVVGDDASAAHFNPAGMALLTQQQIQQSLAYSKVQAQYSDLGSTLANSTGDDKDGAGDSITPVFYWISPINPRMNFGFGITSPFATNTNYPSDSNSRFRGRFSGLTTRIKTSNFNPSVSYKLNDKIALGFGINYQIMEATIAGAVSPQAPGSILTTKGKSKRWGYNLGAMFSFSEDSRLGISYRSKLDHVLRGSAIFEGLGPDNGEFEAQTDFTSPETAHLGYTHKLTENLRASLGYRWTRWSRFQELLVTFPTATASQNTGFDTKWHDSETIMLGLDYTLNSHWTTRAGFALDQTPIPDSTRSVRTVDADRKWYSIGATYHANKRMQFDFAYRYITLENAPVNLDIQRNNTSIGKLVGEFNDVTAHTYAIQLNYKL